MSVVLSQPNLLQYVRLMARMDFGHMKPPLIGNPLGLECKLKSIESVTSVRYESGTSAN